MNTTTISTPAKGNSAKPNALSTGSPVAPAKRRANYKPKGNRIELPLDLLQRLEAFAVKLHTTFGFKPTFVQVIEYQLRDQTPKMEETAPFAGASTADVREAMKG